MVVNPITIAPDATLGDVLALHPVGAYNVVQSMQFIEYRPAVVMIDATPPPRKMRMAARMGAIQPR